MISNVKIVETPDDCKDMPVRDHTVLSNVNTCPKWGIVRYSHSLVMPGDGRALALEAGQSSHEAYAAIRMYQFANYSDHPDRKEVAERVGREMYGDDRYERIISVLSNGATERSNVVSLALEAHYSSGFYDDPGDKRRTVSNIADCLINYVDRWNMTRYPIWYSDDTLDCHVGIEIRFDLLITYDHRDKEHKVRYAGVMDGLHWDGDKRDLVMPHENKTGVMIDDAWLAQWQLSHQITGYIIAAQTISGLIAPKCHVLGMKIPLGKDPGVALREETVKRDKEDFEDFMRWVHHSTQIIEMYEDAPLDAPMYTHSCNRYFRACSMLALCDSDRDEQEEILKEMVYKPWSPLDTKVQG